MPRERIIPLIVAVALFMENMDSTVIATALPAIAADIGTNPLELKLAITSYLLALAIFIPASGWTADRFGARNVFRVAIAIFMCGSRTGEWTVRYPVSDVAAKHGASVEQETTSPDEAYADWEPSRRGKPSYWADLPWVQSVPN